MKKKSYIIILIGILAFVGSMAFLKVNIIDAILGFPSFIKFFITKFIPPSFSNISTYIPSVIDTILFAIVGTYISSILAFILGLLMSDATNKIPFLRTFVTAFVSFLRNIPILIWVTLLIYAFGVGQLVGLIALVIASIGFLSRSYGDSISNIADSRLEALKSSGASYMQVLWHGIIPNFVPSWINWTLYCFEINIRASTILGMVGAGGIGVLIQTNLKLFKYHETCSIILIIITIVLLTELVTNKIRSYLI